MPVLTLDIKSFFQFQWCHRHFKYVSLPQGYADSPRLFSCLTAPIVSELHKRFIDVLLFIDDSFFRAESAEKLKVNIVMAIRLFSHCGFEINMEKSYLQLTLSMEFLGFLLDSVIYTVTVMHEKRMSLFRLSRIFRTIQRALYQSDFWPE